MTKIKYLLILLFALACGFTGYKITHSYFTDTEKVLGNSIQVGIWEITPVATPEITITPMPTEVIPSETPTPTPTETPLQTPTPTNTPIPTPTTTPIVDHLVINEVYYDPDSGHMQGTNPDENDFEWIEIYNPTALTINLKNWKIQDNSANERSISESNRDLLPGDFVVIAKANNVRVIWNIPNEKFIGIGQNFGNGLANGGDRVILKDSDGNIVDQMSYGTDTTAFNPACPDVVEGHSLERNPTGKDTDTAGDFVDRSSPTPGS